MRNGPWQGKSLRALLFAAAPLFCLNMPANAQNSPTQDNRTVQDSRPVQDNDATRRDIAEFNHFLDSHREIAEQVHRDPSLLDNRQFVDNHPALQTYLHDHPAVHHEIQQNPDAFMRQENSFDNRWDVHNGDQDAYASDRFRNVDDRDRGDWSRNLAQFSEFLDSHGEIAEQVRRDPSLLDNQQFVENHPALQTYLQNHPGVRDDIRQNPNAFMQQENRFDRAENGDRDFDRGHLARFGTFLSGHSDIAREVSENPDRVRDQQYIDNQAVSAVFAAIRPDGL